MSTENKRALWKVHLGRMLLATAILATAILSLLMASSGSAAVEPLQEVGGQGLPLGEVLRPDGTLALPAGFRGSLDTRGWRLASGMDEAPRFAPQTTAADGQWADIFYSPGTSGGVYALAVGGDGIVYVGGRFTSAGKVSANYIAMWDGSNWSALSSGMAGDEYPEYPYVGALAVDGSGNVYAGGRFTTAGGVSANNIAMWDGANWSDLGSGMNNSVATLAIDSDGVLYAGGSFTNAGGVSANRFAKWDGASWSALGSGMNGTVSALAIDGDGSVYAGGAFTTAGGISAHNVAMWDGSTWLDLGDGIGRGDYSSSVYALAMDGDGNVYAGGEFDTAGDVSANNIARWDGSSWSALGSGMEGDYTDRYPPVPYVSALAVSGEGVIYAGGTFTIAGDVSADNIARWDGSTWSALGSGLAGGYYPGNVEALAVAGDETLVAGGWFTTGGGVDTNHIARWNGVDWSALGGHGLSGSVTALAVDGNGTLYAAGWFTIVGEVEANHIARWDGSNWSALGNGIGGDYSNVQALAVDGTGNLYAGGWFTTAGGVSANGIAKWDGTNWSALGSGLNGSVSDLALDGDGTLYAGGYFNTAGRVSANYVARWDGANWSALGSGIEYEWLPPSLYSEPYVGALAVDGDGNLYAGGEFNTAGGVSANNIARWDGSSWSALGSGMGGAYPGVFALAVDGHGNLYAGGSFTTAGGVYANTIARWDGSGWSAVGSGTNGTVRALAVDGDGSLYAGGGFAAAGGVSANSIARWDGSNWSALGSGMGGGFPYVESLAADGNRALYAGGYFTTAGGMSSHHVALWIPSLDSAFSASPRSGIAPLTVNFANDSRGYFDTCAWNFGDGGASTDCKNPSHHYPKPGIYSVSLTVSGPMGSDTETKAKYITVNEFGSRLPIIIIGK